VGEFAFVNHVITSKKLPEQLGRLTDELCAHTITILWILSNLLYWPFIPWLSLKLFLGFIEICWFGFNLWKAIWNYRNGKKGWELVRHLKGKWEAKYQTVRREGVSHFDLRRY